MNDPGDYLVFAVSIIDIGINADEAAVMYDGDDGDDRDAELGGDNNQEFTWYMPVADWLVGVVDDAETLLSPLLTILGMVVGAYTDYEEDEEEDTLDGTVGLDEPDRPSAGVCLLILNQVFIPVFFITLRPTVNLLASALTVSLIVSLYELIQFSLGIRFNILWILAGVGFCTLTMIVKGAVAIMQNYFLIVFTGDD